MYAFFKAYNYQNKTNLGITDFMVNPGKYPIKVMVFDNKSKTVVEKIISLDQFDTFEQRYVSGMSGELYYRMPTMDSQGWGYSVEGNKFILYLPIRHSQNTDFFINANYQTSEERYAVLGEFIDDSVISLALLPYSKEKFSSNLGTLAQNNLDGLVTICGGPYPANDRKDPEFAKYFNISSTGALTAKDSKYTNWYSAYGDYLKLKGFLLAK
jgi:hypothetical protein